MSFGLVPIHPNGLSGGQLTDNFKLAVIVPIMVWDWHALTRSCPMDSFLLSRKLILFEIPLSAAQDGYIPLDELEAKEKA